jgi:hypothetical protein
MSIQRTIFVVTLLLVTAGCTHIARVEDLPTSASQIPFDSVSQVEPHGGRFWTQQTKFEHYAEVSPAPLDVFHKQMEESLVNAGYKLVRSDKAQAAIIGKRGTTMMEWGSVAAIYYRPQSARMQVYVRVHVTQDITGSPNYNPASSVGDEVCRVVGGCKLRK